MFYYPTIHMYVQPPHFLSLLARFPVNLTRAPLAKKSFDIVSDQWVVSPFVDPCSKELIFLIVKMAQETDAFKECSDKYILGTFIAKVHTVSISVKNINRAVCDYDSVEWCLFLFFSLKAWPIFLRADSLVISTQPISLSSVEAKNRPPHVIWM